MPQPFSCHGIHFKVDILQSSSSFGTSNPSVAQVPSVQRSPSLSPIPEPFRPHEPGHMATMPSEQVSLALDELGSSTSANPAQGLTQENIPSRTPEQRRALQDDHSFHPAEERRHWHKERVLEGQRAKVWISGLLRVVSYCSLR